MDKYDHQRVTHSTDRIKKTVTELRYIGRISRSAGHIAIADAIKMYADRLDGCCDDIRRVIDE